MVAYIPRQIVLSHETVGGLSSSDNLQLFHGFRAMFRMVTGIVELYATQQFSCRL